MSIYPDWLNISTSAGESTVVYVETMQLSITDDTLALTVADDTIKLTLEPEMELTLL